MPKGVYIRTEYHQIISKTNGLLYGFQKGHINLPEWIEKSKKTINGNYSRKGKIGYWRGKKRGPHSKEWNEKISKSMSGKQNSLGIKRSKETKIKYSKAQKGKKKPPRTKEHCKNLSESNKGISRNKGVKKPPFTEERRRNMSELNRGEKCIFWRGGITPKNTKIRNSIEFRLWRESVFKRDNYTCQKCRIKSGMGYTVYFHPHHILNFAQYPKLRFDVNNGITFCEDCHWEFHRIYGKRNNTKEQIEEFSYAKPIN